MWQKAWLDVSNALNCTLKCTKCNNKYKKNTKEQGIKEIKVLHWNPTCQSAYVNVIFMTVAPERGGRGRGKESEYNSPVSANDCSLANGSSWREKNPTTLTHTHTHICQPSSSKRGQRFSRKSSVTPAASQDTAGRSRYAGFTGNWNLCSALCSKTLPTRVMSERQMIEY